MIDHGYMHSLASRRMVEVLDRTFRMYREHFVVFVAIVACVTIPVALLGLVIQVEQPVYDYMTGETGTQTTTSPLVFLLGGVLQIVAGCVIAYSTSELILGHHASVRAGLNRAFRRFFTLLLAMIFIGIILAFVMGFASFLLVIFASNSCVLIPIFLMSIVGYLLLNASFFILPTIMLERVGFLLGVRRAMTLAKRRFWRNFWFVFHLMMITFVLSIAFSQFTEFILGAANTDSEILSLIVTLAIQIFVTPIFPIGLTLMYYDTRVYTEGLDLALMTSDALEPRPLDIPSPVPRDSGVTNQDIKNIVILSVSIGAIVFALYVLVRLIFESTFY